MAHVVHLVHDMVEPRHNVQQPMSPEEVGFRQESRTNNPGEERKRREENRRELDVRPDDGVIYRHDEDRPQTVKDFVAQHFWRRRELSKAPNTQWRLSTKRHHSSATETKHIQKHVLQQRGLQQPDDGMHARV